MARVGGGEWDITAVAPNAFKGDLRPIVLEHLEGEACRLEGVPVHFDQRIHLMLYGRQLASILRSDWDLVHCWEEPYVLAGAQISALTPRNVPYVFWSAQNLNKWYPPPFSWVERFCLDRAAGWLACGQTTLDTLLKREGYQDLPHRVMPLGVDTQAFRPNAAAGEAVLGRLGWSRRRSPVVGYLGRFIADKGVDLLMSVLEQSRASWRALFVGGGPLEPELRSWAERFGDRVRVVTGVEHAQVPDYLNAMDILCAPSQTTPKWREQLGRMVIEAFACGIPVISSDSGELPWVVGNGGVIVSESDQGAWVGALSDLLESPKERERLSAAGLNRARTLYDWPIIAKQHLSFFSEVLHKRSRPTIGRVTDELLS